MSDTFQFSGATADSMNGQLYVPAPVPEDGDTSPTQESSTPEPAAAAKDQKTQNESNEFVPLEPSSLAETQLSTEHVEALTLKALLNLGSGTGRQIARQLKLPFGLLQDVLHSLKMQMLLTHKGAAAMSDYEYELSQAGLERARRHNEECTYCGAAPVSLDDYINAIQQQAVRKTRPRFADLRAAFSDLIMSDETVSQIGQAVNCGRSLLLYGPPGNGKSSIAERVMRSIGQEIWIPRSIAVGREIIRLFDSSSHEELPLQQDDNLISSSKIDRRWVRIRRPTIVVGGELTLENLAITPNLVSGINEAPLQLKSNCGALVIDDFGRQAVSITELLNRWIIPLEKGYDFISMPSGRQITVPFDQLLIFATNIEPRQIVDEAFLRRIPYKIELNDPNVRTFHEVFSRIAPDYGFESNDEMIDYLVSEHFTSTERPLRYCFARDILEQASNFCDFHDRPAELSREVIDIAVKNYFAGL